MTRENSSTIVRSNYRIAGYKLDPPGLLGQRSRRRHPISPTHSSKPLSPAVFLPISGPVAPVREVLLLARQENVPIWSPIGLSCYLR